MLPRSECKINHLPLLITEIAVLLSLVTFRYGYAVNRLHEAIIIGSGLVVIYCAFRLSYITNKIAVREKEIAVREKEIAKCEREIAVREREAAYACKTESDNKAMALAVVLQNANERYEELREISNRVTVCVTFTPNNNGREYYLSIRTGRSVIFIPVTGGRFGSHLINNNDIGVISRAYVVGHHMFILNNNESTIQVYGVTAVRAHSEFAMQSNKEANNLLDFIHDELSTAII